MRVCSHLVLYDTHAYVCIIHSHKIICCYPVCIVSRVLCVYDAEFVYAYYNGGEYIWDSSPLLLCDGICTHNNREDNTHMCINRAPRRARHKRAIWLVRTKGCEESSCSVSFLRSLDRVFKQYNYRKNMGLVFVSSTASLSLFLWSPVRVVCMMMGS